MNIEILNTYEIYVTILFFINAFAILLINQRYLCLDKFYLHHSLCSFYIISSCSKIKAVLCSNHPLGNRLQYSECKSIRQEDGTFGLSPGIFCPKKLCSWKWTAFSFASVNLFKEWI